MSAPWYGEIPERWRVYKLSDLFIERREKVSDIEFAPLSVSKLGIVPQIATAAKSNDSENRKLVKQGDFAINSRSDRRGSSGVSSYTGSVSLINTVLTPRGNTNRAYWHYMLRSHSFIEEFYRNGRGIVADLWTTRMSEMKAIYLPLPPRDEQDQIVRYLDWKVSQINRLVNTKRRHIALLGEQKRATIYNAVEASNYPKTRIGHLYTSILGKMLQPTKKANTDTLKKYLCAKDVHFDGIDITNSKEMWFSPAEKKQYRVKAGDLLVVEGGAGAGGSYIFDYDADVELYVQNSIQIIRSKGNSSNKFLYYYMFSLVKRGYIDFVCEKATIPHFTKERLLSTIIPVIPYEEQERVVDYLDQQCANIDKIISKFNDEITLLTELRTRLISDVVTGKIDVRGIEIPAYEVYEEVVDPTEVNEPEEAEVPEPEV